MSFPLSGVLAALGCCMVACAQPAAPPSGTIAGIVMDSGSNAPIRRAVVTLSTVEARPQDAVAWTDASGRFAFGYLPPGRYELRVTKNGYQQAVYGAETPRRPPDSVQLAAGEVRSDIVFRLQLVITILGSVVGEGGEPLPGISITAMRWGWQRQKRRLLPGPSVRSDAAGRYRLTGLAPGRYAIVASQLGGPPIQLPSESVAGQPQRSYSYGSQYYPATDRAESATLLSVEPGHEYSQIDFVLSARPIPSVQGRIVPPPGVSMFEQLSINVSREDLANRFTMGSGVSQPDFVFRFDQLQPGSYLLVAQGIAGGRLYRGMQLVEIPSEGVPDLAIPLQPSIDLSGSVSVEGPDAAHSPASFVSLVPGDNIPFNRPQLRAIINKDGSFKISDVPPGIWDINAGPVPPGGYIKSMRLGDQDVLTEEMVIQSSTQAPLKIVISTRAATVQGDVTSNGQPARALVLLAPEPRWRHVLSFYRMVSADANGHFEVKNASPGVYQLYAFDELDRESIQDPEFLKPFESAGVPVTLREGENPPRKLSVISLAGSGAVQ
jgi:Carboxypeptidase regulatory-like domain